MKVRFGSGLLVVTFESDEDFSGKSLSIKGEALACGFDAYPSTMRWGKPYENESISDETKVQIMDKILEYNFKNEKETSFTIVNKEEEIFYGYEQADFKRGITRTYQKSV